MSSTEAASTSKRDQNRAEQRERILDAARLLFTSRGPDRVTMAEVAEEAGVARATVFNYFPSKYALVESITEEVLAYYRGMLQAALEDEKSSTAAIVRALFSHMGAGIEMAHPFYRGVFREIVKIQVGIDEGSAAQRTREGALDLLEKLLRRGQERGELAPGLAPADLAVVFDAVGNGTILHWLYQGMPGSLRERMERAAEIFLGPVVVAGDSGLSESLPDLAPPGFDPSRPVTAVRTPR